MNAAKDFDTRRLADAVREKALPVGAPLSWKDETTSTNDDAIEAAKAGAPHGALFVADRQTRGRGRVGRPWFSPVGQNLYASIVLRPSLPVDQLPCITLAVGLAVADVVESFAPAGRVGIKWPNDVLVGGRKVAGILVESALSGDRCEYVVVGIGLNVAQKSFEPSIERTATSLALVSRQVPARDEVLAAVLEQVTVRLGSLEREGPEAVAADLNARDVTRGREVRVGDAAGVADGIEADGRLRVRVDGELRRLHAGEVEVLDEPGEG